MRDDFRHHTERKKERSPNERPDRPLLPLLKRQISIGRRKKPKDIFRAAVEVPIDQETGVDDEDSNDSGRVHDATMSSFCWCWIVIESCNVW